MNNLDFRIFQNEGDVFKVGDHFLFIGPSPIECDRGDCAKVFAGRWMVIRNSVTIGPFECYGVECNMPAYPIHIGEFISLAMRPLNPEARNQALLALHI